MTFATAASSWARSRSATLGQRQAGDGGQQLRTSETRTRGDASDTARHVERAPKGRSISHCSRNTLVARLAGRPFTRPTRSPAFGYRRRRRFPLRRSVCLAKEREGARRLEIFDAAESSTEKRRQRRKAPAQGAPNKYNQTNTHVFLTRRKGFIRARFRRFKRVPD